MTRDSVADVTLADVERVQAGSLDRLRFPSAIEARFEQDTQQSRCRHLITATFIAVAALNLSLISDARMLPDVFTAAVVVKVGVITPLLLFTVLVLRRDPSPFLRESLVPAAGLLIMLLVMGLAVVSASPLAAFAHYNPAMLNLMFANLVVRARFRFACFASAFAFVAYTVGIAQLDSLPADAMVGAILGMITAAACTLYANFNLERDERRAYLVKLRDELRSTMLMRANNELSRISHLDALTGLANRRGLDRHLEMLWNDATGTNQSICILMLDVDWFKQFNDYYGHQAGDFRLREVAQIASQQMRRTGNLIARFGGEEFVAVLPGSDLLDGIRVAERIRRAIETCAFVHDAVPAKIVTVSIGVAAAPAAAGCLPESIIQAADAALYVAKSQGRNCVWPPILAPVEDQAPATTAAGASRGGIAKVA